MRGAWPWPGNRGFVLIYVLWVSAAVTAAVLLLSRDSRQIMRAEAAAETRMILCHEMADLRQVFRPALKKGGLGTPFQSRIDHCWIEIVDANYFLNLNQASFEEIRRLCLALEMDNHQAEIIADSILDWIDSDFLEHVNGAENTYYLELRPPYRCKNAPLETYSELLLVRGIDRDVLKKMQPFISFGGTGVNFKYAPVQVIYAVTGNWDISHRIIEYRAEHGLDDEAMQMLLESNLYQALVTRLTFDPSGHYRLTIIGSYKGVDEDIREWVKGRFIRAG